MKNPDTTKHPISLHAQSALTARALRNMADEISRTVWKPTITRTAWEAALRSHASDIESAALSEPALAELAELLSRALQSMEQIRKAIEGLRASVETRSKPASAGDPE